MLSRLKNYWQSFSGVEKKLLLFFTLLLIANLFYLTIRTGGAEPGYGGEYTEGLIGQPRHLNPLLAPANDVDMDIARLIGAHEGIIEIGEQTHRNIPL